MLHPAKASQSGIFITLEGGDGAGKTTQAELLATWLQQRGLEVVRTREPGGTPLGAALRELLLHGEHVDPRAEALLYAADRAQHVATLVRPALERGAAVVQDRYIDSSLAYQGVGRPLDIGDVRGLSEWATRDLWPHLTVLLDVTPELAAARRDSDGAVPDRLESEAADFHRAVRQAFLDLAKADERRFVVIDAALPVADIHAQIVARLEQLM